MMSVITAEACAHALIGSARPKDDDLPALLAGELQALDPMGWFRWRCLAATALVEAGYEEGSVRRTLELDTVRVASAIHKIPNAQSADRAEAAYTRLLDLGLFARCEAGK